MEIRIEMNNELKAYWATQIELYNTDTYVVCNQTGYINSRKERLVTIDGDVMVLKGRRAQLAISSAVGPIVEMVKNGEVVAWATSSVPEVPCWIMITFEGKPTEEFLSWLTASSTSLSLERRQELLDLAGIVGPERRRLTA